MQTGKAKVELDLWSNITCKSLTNLVPKVHAPTFVDTSFIGHLRQNPFSTP